MSPYFCELSSQTLSTNIITNNIMSISGLHQRQTDLTGELGVEIKYEELEEHHLMLKYMHNQMNYNEYTDNDFDDYKDSVPEAYTSKNDGTIYLNSTVLIGEKKINVFTHEAHHLTSFKHQGFQKLDSISDVSLRMIFDEAVTDFFTLQTFKKITGSDDEHEYLKHSNYFKDKINKTSWYGDIIREIIKQGIINEDILKNAYFKGECLDAIVKNIDQIIPILKRFQS